MCFAFLAPLCFGPPLCPVTPELPPSLVGTSNPDDAPHTSTSSSHISLCQYNQTMCHSCTAPCGVLANDPRVVPIRASKPDGAPQSKVSWQDNWTDSEPCGVDRAGHRYHWIDPDAV